MVVVFEMPKFVAEHNPVEIREIPVQVNAVVVRPSKQVIFSSL